MWNSNLLNSKTIQSATVPVAPNSSSQKDQMILQETIQLQILALITTSSPPKKNELNAKKFVAMTKAKKPEEETSLESLDKKLKKEANNAISKVVKGEEDA